MASLCRGFVSFDSLFSIIPILLIVSYALFFSALLGARADAGIEKQILFDKLVSASDYAVKIGAAKSSGGGFPSGKVEPNLVPAGVDYSRLAGTLGARLRINLTIGFAEDGFVRSGTCIYRLVVYEPDMNVRKLYFCGG